MAIEPAGPDDVLKSYAKDALPVIRTYTASVQNGQNKPTEDDAD